MAKKSDLLVELALLENRVEKAEHRAWLAEALLENYVVAKALKPFRMAPLSCQYCGGEKIDTVFHAGEEPYKSEFYENQGHPAHMTHHCSSCGAYLGNTKTLEDSL